MKTTRYRDSAVRAVSILPTDRTTCAVVRIVLTDAYPTVDQTPITPVRTASNMTLSGKYKLSQIRLYLVNYALPKIRFYMVSTHWQYILTSKNCI